MNIYDEYKNTMRRCENLEKLLLSREKLLKECKDAMIDMLNAFQTAAEFFYKTGYCDNCSKDADIDCPYRESNGNCSLGYAKEDDIDKLIDKIKEVIK